MIDRLRPLLCLVAALAACSAPVVQPPPVGVRLIAFNDFHGYIVAPESPLAAPDPGDPAHAIALAAGGAGYFAALVQRLEAGHPLHALVAAGDLVGASPFASSLFHDEPTIEVLNAIGLDLSAVGNHEFDHGTTELRRLQSGGCAPGGERGRDTCIGGDFVGARFHYLAANVVEHSDGRTLFPAYELKTFATPSGRSIRIGFIGVVLRGTAQMVMPSGVADLEFRDEVASANAVVPELKAHGADTIVLLIHQGGATSGSFDDHACPDFSGPILAIVDALDPAIRVVVSGHTHQAYICQRSGRLVTSAGSYGRLLTAIDLDFDAASGVLRSAHADNYPVVDVARQGASAAEIAAYPPLLPDPGIDVLLDRYQRIAAPLAQRSVGRISADLTREPSAAGETVLGDVVADSMLAFAHKDAAVIAFTNPGGIREDLLRARAGAGGDISYAQLYAVLPFGNELVAMDLSGAQLLELLREQRSGPAPRPLQISRGFSYAGSAGAVEADSLRLDGVPIDAGKAYRVVVNAFLADGGDGFRVLKEGSNRRVLGSDLDAALDYFAAHSPIAPGPLDRIVCSDCAAQARERRQH